MLDRLRAALEREPWYQGQIVKSISLPGCPAQHATPNLRPELQAYLDARHTVLYRHQAAVIAALHAGKDVIITTPTASGKTLAFNLPVFETLLEHPEACALYLYPLKALANDQLQKIRDIETACGLNLFPATYDGDTPPAQRARIKRSSRIILTNPHALHQYLPWHHQWARIFANLRGLILDEAHQYRGVFGANVSHLLRRLMRIVHHYGGDPRVVLSSASVANPVEFARGLIGRDVIPVTDDASEHGERHVLFWDPLLDPIRSVSVQTAHLLTLLSKTGIQTICFTRTRSSAEVIASVARDLGARDIVSYRAGYLPAERRQIEARLRDGTIRSVVSTTALESGIDIGGLDAAVLVGFPGSLLSAWQQAGRAGRGDTPSLLVFVAFENPLDRFFLHHPDQFLAGPRERLVIPLSNPHLCAGHLACSAAELPLHESELDPPEFELVQGLSHSGLLSPTPRGYVYRGLRRAHEIVSLDDLSEESVHLTCSGTLLETMDSVRARRAAFPGAVFLHRGETYVIDRLDLEHGTAEARKENVDHHTHSLRASEVEFLTTDQTRATSTFVVASGRGRAKESFLGYKVVHADHTVDVHPLDLPPHTYETDAMWISFHGAIPHVPAHLLLGALHGAEHALLAMSPLLVLCDAADVAGVSTPFHPQTQQPTIVLFDHASGGTGIAPSLFEAVDSLATRAHALVRDCRCESGCPSCLLSPRCGSYNEPLSKTGSLRILEHLVHHLNVGGRRR